MALGQAASGGNGAAAHQATRDTPHAPPHSDSVHDLTAVSFLACAMTLLCQMAQRPMRPERGKASVAAPPLCEISGLQLRYTMFRS